MKRAELEANIATVADRAREAVRLTVPDLTAEAREAGLLVPPQTVTRDELIAASGMTAAAVYLALIEHFEVELEQEPEPVTQ